MEVLEGAIDRAGLRHYCRGVIADDKVPKVVLPVAAVPRSPVGKVDHRATRSLAAERVAARTEV